jgi:hypothetical protein
MSFLSFYWEGVTLPPDEHSIVDTLGDPEVPVAERKLALLRLLESKNTIVRGIALDHYSMSNASLRQGTAPMLDQAIDTAARACALRELAQPPYERAEANAKPKRGANHASALHALWFNADPSDAPLIARVLVENQDDRVLAPGVGAAEPVLRGEPAHPALVDALLHIVNRRDIDPRVRGEAIAAIGGATDDTVESPLVDALMNPELAVSAAAARTLLERDLERYRSTVGPVAAAWPAVEFPPFDVHEVRRLLEGD